MMLRPTKPARAGVLVAAMVLAAIATIGLSPAGAVPPPAPSPSPTGNVLNIETGMLCPPKAPCNGGSRFLCAGGTDCGLWFLRHGCTDCPQVILDFDLRAQTTAGDPEQHTGQIVFEAGRAATAMAFRPSAPVTIIDITLKTGGAVVFQQTIR